MKRSLRTLDGIVTHVAFLGTFVDAIGTTGYILLALQLEVRDVART